GSLFTRHILPALVIGWIAGVAASACGLVGSFLLDLPTGASLVVAFALALLVAGLVRLLAAGSREMRRRNRARVVRVAAALVPVVGLSASLWLILWPAADQPVLALLEKATGIGPERFLPAPERAAFVEAGEFEARYAAELAALNRREQESRWRG